MGAWSLQETVFAVFVGTFSLAAAFCDFRTHKIPNLLTIPMFLLGLVFQGWFGGWPGLLHALGAFGLGFGTLFVLWMMGSGGGGDVKLMGALAVWLGLRMTILVMVFSTITVFVGTFVMVGITVFSRSGNATDEPPDEAAAEEATENGETKQKRRMMAYAIPVAVATWMLMVMELPPL